MYAMNPFDSKLPHMTKKIVLSILLVMSAILSNPFSIGCSHADATPPVITATPPTGAYDSSHTVTLAASKPATIYYTTNGNSITGRVTDGNTGSGILGVLAIAYKQDSYDPPTVAHTDTAGDYLITGLAAGRYLLYFTYGGNSDYRSQWYDNKPDQQSANLVTVNEASTTTGINAVLRKGGKISGTVSDTVTGFGIPDIQVIAYSADNGSWTGSDLTDASGAFSIGGVASGGYKLKFVGVDHVNQWYQGKTGKDSATVVTVIAPNTTADINVAMTTGAAISGTVTDKANGTALSDISVTAYNADTMEYARYGFTDGSGAYRLGGLPPGRYAIRFSAMYGTDYQEQWHSGAPDRTSATIITLTDKQTVGGINASLQRGGKISGKVTDSRTGAGIPSTHLTVYRKNDGAWVGSALTDANGAYQTSPLPSGSYTVQAGCNDYLCQWYNGKASRDEATAISVSAPSTTSGIDIALTKGGGISGRITDRSSGLPIAGAGLSLDNGNYSIWGGQLSDSDGRYNITGLPSGSYRIWINPPSGSQYIGTRYGSEGTDYCQGVVQVTAPEITTGIDASLEMGGSISGRITDSVTGSAIVGATVSLSGNPAFTQFNPMIGIGVSADSGDYTINGIPPGTYSIDFDAPGYLRAGTVLPLPVSADAPLTGIDIGLTKGGSIRGRVTDSVTGSGIPNIWLTAYPEAPEIRAGSGTSGADGTYSIDGLASGNYAVSFTSSGDKKYGAGWYTAVSPHAPISPDAGSMGSNTSAVSVTYTGTGQPLQIRDYAVSVIAPEATTGIDMKLTTKGSITGKLTNSNGTPIGWISVSAHDPVSGYPVSTTHTNSDGTYTLGGLPTGDYWVYFSGTPLPPSSNPGYLSGWYGASKRIAVSVNEPQTTRDIDAILAPAGGITGSIEVNGCPEPEQVRIILHDATTGNLVSQQYHFTGSDRQFSISGLPAGSYKLLFVPLDSGFAQQWYPARQNLTDAEAVKVTAGAFTEIIDVLLAPGGAAISGRAVTSAGYPLAVTANLYDWYSGDLVSETVTGHSGYYRLHGIPDGKYKLLFTGSGVNQWYRTDDVTGQASPLTLSGSVPLRNIDLVGHVVPDGDIDGSGGRPDLRDAIKALRIAVGLDEPTPEMLIHGDVAPRVNGVPAPDGKITIADAIVILQMIVGKVN